MRLRLAICTRGGIDDDNGHTVSLTGSRKEQPRCDAIRCTHASNQ
jgi:hypothetical protein